MNKHLVDTLFALLTSYIVVAGACLQAWGEEPDKPTGFTGYLLDSRGLEEENNDSIWKEDFESPGVSWRYLYQSGSVAVEKHCRTKDFACQGRQAEFLRYEVEEPGVVIFAHYVDYPNVYSDTSPSLWVRSDRPGVSLAALVVFPKTRRPDNGQPLMAVVPGSSYQKPGEWQKLEFTPGLEKALEKTVQSIRGENKIPVSVECAYVRQLLLVSETRVGRYSLWVDDLEIKEHLAPTIESLREWERDSTFAPINLLSARLQLSNTPIFGQDEYGDSDSYGKEPFGIDQEKVKQKIRRKLDFVADQFSVATKEESAQSFSTPEPQTTFDAASFFLKSADGGRPLSIDQMFANSGTKRDFRNDFVGQASFMDGARETGRVSSAAFDASVLPPQEHAAKSEPSANAEIVVGSGTLSNPEYAITESFKRSDDRLVADAHFSSGVLKTDDEQTVYMIRAIEYRKEPFAFLKQLGFNAVWLSGVPSARQLQEAQEAGIWLIAEPPYASGVVTEEDLKAAAEALKKEREAAQNANTVQNVATPRSDETLRVANTAGQSESGERFGGQPVNSAYDPVLLWNLGSELRIENVAALQKTATELRALDPRKRPTIGSVLSGVDEYSREGRLDALMLTREPLLSSLDLNDYGEWLIKYQNLSTNSRAVFWNRIQTQPTYSATLQRQFFGMADETPGVVSYEQMRQMVRLSMRAGCRGFLFSSQSPLNAKDHKTQYRAAALESINLELQLIAPWVTFGKTRQDLVSTSEPSFKGLVSKSTRSLLFVPISTEPNNQYVMGQDACNNLTATVPTPENYTPDLLTPGALRKIVSRRRAGGCRFTLDEGSMNSLLFFTQSDSVSQKVSERAPAYGARLAKLAISLARKRLDLYEETVYSLRYVEEHGYFPKSAPRAPALGEVVERIADQIDEAEVYLQRRDASQAYLTAERATREIRKVEREFWTAATRNEIARPVTPLSTTFYDMPAYLELYEKLLSGKLHATGGNLIVGGDMEDQKTWLSGGWRIFEEKNSVLTSSSELAPYEPTQEELDSGAKRPNGRALRILVGPKTGYENRIPQQMEIPTLSVETEFNTQMGQIICFQGWIKIPNDLTNSVDGIEIYDDLGGKGLALRFRKAIGWTRFAFYRLATNTGPMRIRFDVSGAGEIWLDEIAAYVVGTIDKAAN